LANRFSVFHKFSLIWAPSFDFKAIYHVHNVGITYAMENDDMIEFDEEY